jgi:hypothetical protein
MTDAGLPFISVPSYARDFAKSLGLSAESAKEEGGSRWWLRDQAAKESAAA